MTEQNITLRNTTEKNLLTLADGIINNRTQMSQIKLD
jgi:hypothetical protein